MINRTTLGLVLLVSCAHAMVHTYEQSLPSVEQRIAAEFFADSPADGKAMTGRLSNIWRLMWGVGGILAGWLVDYLGGRRMLAIYLMGCAVSCGLAACSGTNSQLFWAMLLMGAFASIYHPAGLTLISHETSPLNRARAQGIHGVFGSAGIGLAPLAVGLLFSFGATWRQVYWVLIIPGGILGVIFVIQSLRHHAPSKTVVIEPPLHSEREDADKTSFVVLTVVASLQGIVYTAVTSFLPRYLAGGLGQAGIVSRDSLANYLAAGVLFIGCIGQYTSGRWANSASLEKQLSWISFGNVPFLVWMAVATGWTRVTSVGFFALVHFMNQPIYNTLIAKYTPRRRRGMYYGLSFAMGQGIGSFGAGFAGSSQSDALVYGVLAGVALLAGIKCTVLALLNREPVSGSGSVSRTMEA